MKTRVEEFLPTGLTYRRLDHWTRSGYLKPIGGVGTGHVREWPQTELKVATVPGQIVVEVAP